MHLEKKWANLAIPYRKRKKDKINKNKENDKTENLSDIQNVCY